MLEIALVYCQYFATDVLNSMDGLLASYSLAISTLHIDTLSHCAVEINQFLQALYRATSAHSGT